MNWLRYHPWKWIDSCRRNSTQTIKKGFGVRKIAFQFFCSDSGTSSTYCIAPHRCNQQNGSSINRPSVCKCHHIRQDRYYANGTIRKTANVKHLTSTICLFSIRDLTHSFSQLSMWIGSFLFAWIPKSKIAWRSTCARDQSSRAVSKSYSQKMSSRVISGVLARRKILKSVICLNWVTINQSELIFWNTRFWDLKFRSHSLLPVSFHLFLRSLFRSLL
jgi:hypothetical protein